MSEASFLSKDNLQDFIGKKLKLKINDNYSTMLSVRWDPDQTKVSMHRMFLDAPQNVMQALACYIKGDNKDVGPAINSYIQDNLKNYNYSHLIDQKSLDLQGHVYNLQDIYSEINRKYFGNSLDLLITWFGKRHQKNRSRITLGLFQETLRLIKIHRILDFTTVPSYVIGFIIYHEVLHHECPAYVDENGINQIHNKEFKERECLFEEYDLAQDWIEKNKTEMFTEF